MRLTAPAARFAKRAVSLRASILRVLPLALVFLPGCSRSDTPSVLGAPHRERFSAVSSVLERRCGGLDCHGEPARNLRVYGRFGLRLDGRDVVGGAETTDAEVDATYESVITVSPERLSRVTAARGADADGWLVLSKGRGREAHVGGSRLVAGTPADDCVLSWLADSVDTALCAEDDFGPAPRAGETW